MFPTSSITSTDRSWTATAMRPPRTQPAEPGRAHEESPRYGLFQLHANNCKRHAGKIVEYIDCYGSLYPDGPVHLHTSALTPTDFLSWRQFVEHLDALGEYRIVWMARPTSTDDVV